MVDLSGGVSDGGALIICSIPEPLYLSLGQISERHALYSAERQFFISLCNRQCGALLTDVRRVTAPGKFLVGF